VVDGGIIVDVVDTVVEELDKVVVELVKIVVSNVIEVEVVDVELVIGRVVDVRLNGNNVVDVEFIFEVVLTVVLEEVELISKITESEEFNEIFDSALIEIKETETKIIMEIRRRSTLILTSDFVPMFVLNFISSPH
jgi:hypothetical protein